MTSTKETLQGNGHGSQTDEVQVHTFGVGHGDCILVELKQSGSPVFRVLCDAGKKGGQHIDSLKSHILKSKKDTGVDIDVVVLTHVDYDHQGGLHDLFDDSSISIGEYWGPCTPAFRRLSWLFSKRVKSSLDKAEALETMLAKREISVIYPMEGHTNNWSNGRVVATVISPPARLLNRLMNGSKEQQKDLLSVEPTPLEWLIAPAEGTEMDGQDGNLALLQRKFSTPSDFPENLPAEEVEVESTTGMYSDEENEPNFFGNRVLNDTSIVIALDVWLDGRKRRRILLTGDQENWSYIAAQHPAGLGIDVIKVPHHGGMVYLADKKDDDRASGEVGAIAQTYLWLRPRIAIMSAKGTYGLPHTHVRNALRLIGSAVLCTNVRGLERITPPSNDINLEGSCYTAYACNKNEQPISTVLKLTGEAETLDRPACVSDCGARGASPIVVMTQRIFEPDEAFLRWTNGELEKHANWLLEVLKDEKKKFTNSIATKGVLAAMEYQPVTWFTIRTYAQDNERHHFLSSPYQALHYAKARGFIWTEGDLTRDLNNCQFYVRPSSSEIDVVWRWIKKFPHILLNANRNWSTLIGNDRLSLLNGADTAILSRLVASKLHAPHLLVESEVMPRLFLRMAKYFTFRACDGKYPQKYMNRSSYGHDEILLHLSSKLRPPVKFPDLFNSDWKKEIFDSHDLTDSQLAFFLSQAELHAFVGPAIVTTGNSLRINRQALSQFEREYDWTSPEVRISGVFQGRFDKAKWMNIG